VLDRVAAPLRDIWTATAAHGVEPAMLDVAYRCLEAVTPKRAVDAPETADEAVALLYVLVDELATLEVLAEFDDEQAHVRVAIADESPDWGYQGLTHVIVSVTIGELDGGWVIGQECARFVAIVVASCDQTGAAAEWIAASRIATAAAAGR
jgi:hypothetical protein